MEYVRRKFTLIKQNKLSKHEFSIAFKYIKTNTYTVKTQNTKIKYYILIIFITLVWCKSSL